MKTACQLLMLPQRQYCPGIPQSGMLRMEREGEEERAVEGCSGWEERREQSAESAERANAERRAGRRGPNSEPTHSQETVVKVVSTRQIKATNHVVDMD